MITLKEKQEIIMMHVREGRSIREISRVTGLHRKTVTRYVRTYEESRAKLVQQDPSIDIFALTNEIIEKPTYKKRIRTYRKMTTEMEEQVKQHLAENEVKMKNGQRKQVKKAIDIYESLTEQGANISYSTIRRIVCRLKTNTQEAFIKMEYTPGDVCEFDWGNVTLTVDGVEKKYELAVFTSAFGNFRYAKVYTKQKTEHFQEAHASFFDHIGGVYRTMVYDNMRVAVASFVGQEKHPTEALSQ